MPTETLPTDEIQRQPAILKDYVAMARPDHWIKHIFIVPGIVLAYILHPSDLRVAFLPVLLGLIGACAIASANYVLNEWLDLRFDRHHPVKSKRPAVQKDVSRTLVVLEYVGLAAIGLALAAQVSGLFLVTSIVFLLSGLAYNVPGLRTKDRVYVDVITEAVNNPIRLTLGWAMIWPETLPPSSLLLAYWMGGAFLMAIKRFAEYRTLAASVGIETLGLYRRSFRFYTENRLLISAFLYSQLAAFFLAVFLIKYRIEYLLSLPLFAALFTAYLRVGLKKGSVAQAPETLFREKLLMTIGLLLVAALAFLTWFDLPQLEHLSVPHYLSAPVPPSL